MSFSSWLGLFAWSMGGSFAKRPKLKLRHFTLKTEEDRTVYCGGIPMAVRIRSPTQAFL